MLSKRLLKVASLVDTEEIIDIGCDHALLDIYSTNKGYKCTAIDNKETVLNITYNNIKESNLLDKINIVCSNGLDNYKVKGTETVIIAGMGTNTILEILKNQEFDKINTLIIQSNNDLYKLRKEICKNYYIDKEIIVFDKKYYNIIKFKKGKRKYSYFDYYFGLSNDKNYINYLYNKLYNVYINIPLKKIIKKIKYKILLFKIRRL